MKYTNKYCLPDSIVEALTKDTYDGAKNDNNSLSATTLILPPKIRQLQVRHWDEIEEDISESIWKLLGSATHEVLDRVSDKNRIKEERTTEQVGDTLITGKVDLYEKELKVIQDYKVTSVWSVIYGKKEWEEQLNIYCWLLRKKGYEVEALRIIAILKDWTASKLKDSDNYPRIPIAVVNIPMWTLEEQDKYVNERIRVHKEAEKLPDDKIPICSKEERWAKDDSYAIYKVGSLGKALRVFNNEAEAREFKELMVDQNETLKLVIKLRRGESRRCTGYCSVAHLCNYGKTLIKEGM